MSDDRIFILASYRLFMHWVKLYFPQKVNDWDKVRTQEEAEDEHIAHFQLIEYLKREPSCEDRLFSFLQVLDIRETRQLCLGEQIPATIKEEANLLFKEAQELFDKAEKRANASSGEIGESEPT
ncbi:MAG: hypothetical protein FWC21_06680 [Treponema sp.]|nr:hypothetical protein [Treponema sp.]